MELAPRDIVARAIQTEIDQGRGREGGFVDLDLTHLGEERIESRLPGIRQISMEFAGIDPVTEPIPVQPGQHYSMGGVDIGNDCATGLPGLYAAGECACVSVHGANRLGGNSLLETVVFGRIAGNSMASSAERSADPDMTSIKGGLENESRRIETKLRREGGERQSTMREDLKQVMWDCFGIFRNEESMEKGMARIREIQSRIGSVSIDDKARCFNQALVEVMELEGMVRIAESVGLSALYRRESRGSHFRTDFPNRDDREFLKHTITTVREGGLLISYSPVRLGTFAVKEREY
jgi:succinate dehydrogenase / fumarate reductase flavoprotein subunit